MLGRALSVLSLTELRAVLTFIPASSYTSLERGSAGEGGGCMEVHAEG